jgi:protein associated with RNAse G/E
MAKNNKNWITLNSSQYVILKARTNKNFFSLYLDIRYNGKRIYENLHFRLSTSNNRINIIDNNLFYCINILVLFEINKC